MRSTRPAVRSQGPAGAKLQKQPPKGQGACAVSLPPILFGSEPGAGKNLEEGPGPCKERPWPAKPGLMREMRYNVRKLREAILLALLLLKSYFKTVVVITKGRTECTVKGRQNSQLYVSVQWVPRPVLAQRCQGASNDGWPPVVGRRTEPLSFQS